MNLKLILEEIELVEKLLNKTPDSESKRTIEANVNLMKSFLPKQENNSNKFMVELREKKNKETDELFNETVLLVDSLREKITLEKSHEIMKRCRWHFNNEEIACLKKIAMGDLAYLISEYEGEIGGF